MQRLEFLTAGYECLKVITFVPTTWQMVTWQCTANQQSPRV